MPHPTTPCDPDTAAWVKVAAADRPPDDFAWSRPGVCRAVVAMADILDLA